jgi:hypothetical protein
MPKKAKFKFADYDGSLAAHPHVEKKGKLVLPSGMPPVWRLYWGVGRLITGGLTRHPIEVHATGAASCRAVIRDVMNPAVAASFVLPDTPASDLKAALEERETETLLASRKRLAAGAGASAAQDPDRQPGKSRSRPKARP